MSWSDRRLPRFAGALPRRRGLRTGTTSRPPDPLASAAIDDVPTRPSRRAHLVAALLLSAALGGCGFRLRGTQQLPFETLHLAAPANSQLAVELARAIVVGTRTKIAADRAQAQVVVEILGEARERDVLSVNAQGRAREYTFRLRVALRVHDGRGRELLPRTPLAASRDLAVTEAELLARGAEEAQLYRDMQTDLVQQILRRLSVLKI